MKKWLIAAAIVASGLIGRDAQAQQPGCSNCATPAPAMPAYGHGYGGHGLSHHGALAGHPLFQANHPHKAHPFLGHPWLTPGQHLTRMPTLPVYMAAPWYLYWPYDGHFQTVAPMAAGIYYPPPQYIGNPYLVGGYGGGYVPGNPAPRYPTPPAP